MLPNDDSYMVYNIAWDQEKQKYRKKPCGLQGQSLFKDQSIPTSTREHVEACIAALPKGHYQMGYWLSEGSGLFFIDLDECVTDGKLDADASRIAAPFIAAGCMIEASSSGRGAHIIGSYTGTLPPHSNKRPKVHKYEFYIKQRGIALSLHTAQGDSSVDATAQLLQLLPDVFPPRNESQELLPVGERRPEWSGPEDDDELIRRALAAQGSVAARMGGKVTFAALWAGSVEKNNESDMALAAHLAFWTGCDMERMKRLMWRSGLVRDKWTSHRTYLDLTCNQACATTSNVYKEPVRQDMVGATSGVDWSETVEDAIKIVNGAQTHKELLEDVLPQLQQHQWPEAYGERVAQTLWKKLDWFNGKLPINKVRQLLKPPVVMEANGSAPPDWFAPFCYIKRNDRFYNHITGSEYTPESFRTEYARFMPMKGNGTREDPVQWARDRWNVVTIDDVWYRPDVVDTYFNYAGLQFVNKYRPSLLPVAVPPSEDAKAAIQAFQLHLYGLCSNRDDLYRQVLMWLAYNVQKPGHKIRWSPLFKGVGGDGKSIIGDLMFAAMGETNVRITSPATLSNNGGFTDWATGFAVNIIEEIKLEGVDRRKLYNAMKILVGDRRIELNKKGRASTDGAIVNITNHLAFTNYGDAVPLDKDDRRFCVIFTPHTSIAEAVTAKGLAGVDDLVRHFKWLGTSMRSEAGAWRGWLLSLDTSSFDPDGRAPETPERTAMILASSDSIDQIVMDIIDNGGRGISKEVFSAGRLAGMVKLQGSEPPHGRGWNGLLSRLGYQQMEKTVKWDGSMHRIWTKKPLDVEKVRELLSKTLF